MSTIDWYRSSAWKNSAQAEFHERLARSRPHNRIQYRRIKAVALLETQDPAKCAAARRLLIEVVEAPDVPDFERVIALSLLGQHALRMGHLDEAEANLRDALACAAAGNGSGTSGLEEAWLAQVALARGDRAALEEARVLLERRAADPPIFVSAQFEIAVTATKVARALGDWPSAASWAHHALGLADAAQSGPKNHPRSEMVTASREERDWLARVAEG